MTAQDGSNHPSLGWASGFEARARSYWTQDRLQQVTKGKDLHVLPTEAATLLRVLGLLHRDASMPPPQVRKYLQLNHMLRLLGPPLRELTKRFETLHILDAGCGLSYLTMALAWCFEHRFEHPATLLGIDRRPELIESCRAAAARVGLSSRLRFEASSIETLQLDVPPQVVLSLHACDTATDDAIALGLSQRAELIAVAPCCQAELSRAWAARAEENDNKHPLQPLWSTPHLRREAAATLTDTLRMLLLRAAGYEVRVVEFIPSEHTPKNTLIRAMRRGDTDHDAVAAYRKLRDETCGGTRLALERALPPELQALTE